MDMTMAKRLAKAARRQAEQESKKYATPGGGVNYAYIAGSLTAQLQLVLFDMETQIELLKKAEIDQLNSL
jgi:hypothetical protein